MVNTDGTAYLEYEVRNTVNNVVTSDTLYLMQINPDNSSSSTILSATTQNETQYPGNIIPDGQGGVLATWSVSVVQGTQLIYPYQAVDVSGGFVGTPYSLPFSPQSVNIAQQPALALGENGVAFVKGSTTVPINGVQTKHISYPLDSDGRSGGINKVHCTDRLALLKETTVTLSLGVIERIEVSTRTVPTDFLESDGALDRS